MIIFKSFWDLEATQGVLQNRSCHDNSHLIGFQKVGILTTFVKINYINITY